MGVKMEGSRDGCTRSSCSDIEMWGSKAARAKSRRREGREKPRSLFSLRSCGRFFSVKP